MSAMPLSVADGSVPDGDDEAIDDLGAVKGALYKRKDFLGIEEEGALLLLLLCAALYHVFALTPTTRCIFQPSCTRPARTITARTWT